jgi:hypothetical protein
VEARKMIRSFSQVSAFQKQIIEINSQPRGRELGFYWRKRGAGVILVYMSGQVIGQVGSTTDAIFLVRDYAKRIGLYYAPELPEHYITFLDNTFRLYANGRFIKKSKIKQELLDYLEIMTWLNTSGKGSSWGRK